MTYNPTEASDYDFKVIPIGLHVLFLYEVTREANFSGLEGQLCCKSMLYWKCLRSLVETFHFGLN